MSIISKPKTLADYLNNVDSQMVEVDYYIKAQTPDYESALIKARYALEALNKLIHCLEKEVRAGDAV